MKLKWKLKLNYLGVLIILGLIVACQSPKPIGTSVKINRVVSGNTVEWTDSTQQPPTIIKGRLIGIVAPKITQKPWGIQARERLEKLLINNPEIRIESDRVLEDDFSQKLIYIWDKNTLINELMLKEGLAISKSYSSNLKYDDRLKNAQSYGRTMQKGIWDINQPMRTLNQN